MEISIKSMPKNRFGSKAYNGQIPLAENVTMFCSMRWYQITLMVNHLCFGSFLCRFLLLSTDYLLIIHVSEFITHFFLYWTWRIWKTRPKIFLHLAHVEIKPESIINLSEGSFTLHLYGEKRRTAQTSWCNVKCRKKFDPFYVSIYIRKRFSGRRRMSRMRYCFG